MKYKNYNDYELISMVRENDDTSYYSLFNKYQPIIKKIALEYYAKFQCYGYDYDDFLQEAYIGFQSAVINYNVSKNTVFYTFVDLCTRRHLISYCRKITSVNKNISINNFVSIDDIDFFDKCADVNNIVDYNLVAAIVKECLYASNIEYSAPFELRMNNFSFSEISTLLDIPISTIGHKIEILRKNIKIKLKKSHII